MNRVDDVLSCADLPSLPEVAHRILLLAQNPSADVNELADAVKADPAISAKILRTANSAFFGRQYTVRSVRAAIPVLGATLTRTLVLGFSLTQSETWKMLERGYRRFWRSALTQAAAAEALAKRMPEADADGYFIAGLLQDIGRLAMLRAMPYEYGDTALSQLSVEDLPRHERRKFGFTHIDVSERFCQGLQLDKSTVQAIRSHHEELDLLSSAPRGGLDPALKLASRCAEIIDSEAREPSRQFKKAIALSFGVKAQQLTSFIEEVHTRVEGAAHVFAVDIGSLPPVHELLGRAKVAIEDIAVRSQFEAARAKKHAILAHDQLAELEQRSRHLEQEMFKDPLTGAYNRRVLDTELDSLVARSLSEDKPLGLLFLDIDNFKTLNDVCGHEAGDLALQDVADVLARVLRKDDLVVRYGGDEFLVILLGISRYALNEVATRICSEVRDALQTDAVAASASVGGLHCSPEEIADTDPSSLIPAVDERMYRAKRNGGNQHVIEPLVVEHACK